MASRVCLIHYHEIGLKGKNRSTFENLLIRNLMRALRGSSVMKITKISGYLLAEPEDETEVDELASRMARVPGVARVSLAYRCVQVEEEYCDAAIKALADAEPFSTFKVHARRSSTNYERHTLEMNKIVGAALCEAFPEKKVLMHHPDATVVVHAVQASVYVYASHINAAGGLPVGSAAKVVSLLSSGFDSPVATWMLGRRGACVVPLHFSGRPVTEDTSELLCQDIMDALGPAGIASRLYVVPFGEVQREIALSVPDPLRVIMYRRMMLRVAQALAELEGAKAIVTGESLGQVASQTLENIAAVAEVCDLPILRPLIGSDKQEIIARAKEIGTAEISTRTAPDCCTLFMPRSPETHARIDAVKRAEEALDIKHMLSMLMDNIEWVDYDYCAAYHAPKGLGSIHKQLGPA